MRKILQRWQKKRKLEKITTEQSNDSDNLSVGQVQIQVNAS